MPKRKLHEMKEKAIVALLLALIVLGIGYVWHDDYQVKLLEKEAGLSTFNY